MPEDMRDIIDLALNRHLERYLKQREIERTILGGDTSAAASDADAFARQIQDLLG